MEPPGRVSIAGRGDRTTIILRPSVMWGTALLSLVSLVAASAFLLFIPVRYLIEAFPLRSDSGYMVMEWAEVFMCLVAAYFAAAMGLRALALREAITVGPRDLRLRSGVLPLSRPERFRAEYMRRLRVSPEALVHADAVAADPWQFVQGRNVAFDYGLQTVRLGLRLSPSEALRVVGEIRRHLTIPDVPYTLEEAAALREARRGDGPPPAPRTRVEQTPSELRITIPARRSRLLAVTYGLGFLAVICFAFLSLFPSLLDEQATSPRPDVMLFLHIGAILAIGRMALWYLYGREEITIDARRTMRIVHHFGLLQPEYSFDLRRVYDLAVSIQPHAPGASALGLEGGNIRFAYPDEPRPKYHRFGIGLPEAEAEAIATLLEKRLDLPDRRLEVTTA